MAGVMHMQVINKPVEMIAQHSSEGKVLPMRFRIAMDDDVKAFDIKVRNQEELVIDKKRVLSFNCEFIDNGYRRNCEIRFDTVNLMWSIHRM